MDANQHHQQRPTGSTQRDTAFSNIFGSSRPPTNSLGPRSGSGFNARQPDPLQSGQNVPFGAIPPPPQFRHQNVTGGVGHHPQSPRINNTNDQQQQPPPPPQQVPTHQFQNMAVSERQGEFSRPMPFNPEHRPRPGPGPDNVAPLISPAPSPLQVSRDSNNMNVNHNNPNNPNIPNNPNNLSNPNNSYSDNNANNRISPNNLNNPNNLNPNNKQPFYPPPQNSQIPFRSASAGPQIGPQMKPSDRGDRPDNAAFDFVNSQQNQRPPGPPEQFPHDRPVSYTPRSNIPHQNMQRPLNQYYQHNGHQQPYPNDQSMRSMSLTSDSIRPPMPGHVDRGPNSHQNMTISGRVIPRRQGPDIFPPMHPHHGPHNSNGGSNPNRTGPLGTPHLPTSKSTPSLKQNIQNVQKSHRTPSNASIRSNNYDDALIPATSGSSQNTASTGIFPGGGLRTPFPPSTTIITTSRLVPLVYPALLSKVAQEFRKRITLRDHIKNELTYTNSFTGSEAVDMVAYIMKTPDRNLALLLGRALDAQKFFHDVTYEHRLRDRNTEVYQFNEIMIDEHDNDEEKAMALSNNNNTHLGTSRSNSVSTAASTQASTGNANNDKNPHTATVPVNGVFVVAANCYSPTCTRDRLCYSITCPRRLEQQARLNMKPNSVLKRAESRLSLHGDDEKEQKLWIHTVPKEIADSVSDKEKKRQEVICELIYTERDFVKDLEYLRDFWIKPLRASNIIPEARRENFLRTVFGTIPEVHAVNAKLAEALTKRQQQTAVVRQIADIFLDIVPKFEPFVIYGRKQVYAKYEFEREKSVNPAFAKFVDDTERLKESRKLELNGYLTKPTTRLARYPLFLDAVLKATDDSNPDKEDLPRARALVREFLTRVNKESGKAENRLALMQLNQSIRFRPNEKVDLKLTDENREIIFKGNLKKRTQDKENQGDVQVYLFDNSLLFLRPKVVNKRELLTVYRKPIPLELLVIIESDEALPKGSSRRTSSSLISSAAKVAQPIRENAQNKYPLMFQHLGRRGYELILYASTFIGRKKWVEHIMHQKEALRSKSDVYTQHTLMQKFFDPSNRANCVTPLDGGRKLLYGTDNGIWISDTRASAGGGGRVTSTPQKVINMMSVTQIDVIEEYNTLLALSGKTLYAWPLDCLEALDPQGNERRARKVMSHINFYKVGICLGRILVCTAKNGSSTSYIKVLEPADPAPRGKRPPLRKFLQGQSEGFRVFKDCYVPSEIVSISFLTSMLCVGCAKGFEVVSLQTNETQSLLDPADTSLDFVLRREALKPMAIWRLHGNFLLNYSDFTFYVNRNGWRLRGDWIIHWEGLPQNFALSYPYMIAFEPNFVEIRHVETGELVRVITGENIRFLHENTREIMYAYEDENGYDVVATLDFWEKTKNQEEGASGGSGESGNNANVNANANSNQNGNQANNPGAKPGPSSTEGSQNSSLNLVPTSTDASEVSTLVTGSRSASSSYPSSFQQPSHSQSLHPQSSYPQQQYQQHPPQQQNPYQQQQHPYPQSQSQSQHHGSQVPQSRAPSAGRAPDNVPGGYH